MIGRRSFLGALAVAGLSDGKLFAASRKAKRVIYLFQSGGPSQMDLFDPKPKLLDATPLPVLGSEYSRGE